MISIIIPLYNVENYISYCLKSFENQIYKNFELIIVDDGSTDNSASLVIEYMKNSRMNIQLLRQKNSGVSAARNKGLSKAKGDYICFVDSDDMVSPYYLSEMKKVIDKNNCDLVFCGIKSISENWDNNNIYISRQTTDLIDSKDALKKFLYNEIVSGVWSLMVKKDIIEKHIIRFAEGYHYSEDVEYIWKLLIHSSIVGKTNSKLYLYRVRNGSAMSYMDKRRMEALKLMLRLEGYIEKERLDFYSEFKKFGVARWIWSTLWQIAVACDNYSGFKEASIKLQAKKYMKKLITFKSKKVSMSSFLFILFPPLYYFIVRYIGQKRFEGRKVIVS